MGVKLFILCLEGVLQLFWKYPRKKLRGVNSFLDGSGELREGREGVRNNERPGTDRVTSALMRGLKKTAPDGAEIQTYTQTWQIYD